MPFCSIDEAFPDTTMRQGRIAKKEERKRAEKCGGPALAFLKGIDTDVYSEADPDRKAEKPLPPPEAMNSMKKEGFNNQMNSVSKELLTKKVNDVIGQEESSYFGKSVEGYADFTNSLSDNPGYQVLPADFLGTFGAVGANKASGKMALSTPSVNDAWKPLTPSGARTSFFEYLPAVGGGGQEISSESSFFSREDKEALLKKIDTLFAKLEDLESKHNEYAHTEITLFVLSGLFLLYGIESLKKIGRR